MGGAAHVPQGDGLRDVAVPDGDARAAALLGARDLSSWGGSSGAAAARQSSPLSLPISGVLAYRYWVGAGRLRNRLRFGALALVRAHAARRLTTERQAIIAELEQAKNEYLAATKGSSLLSVRLLEEMSTPALDALDRARAPWSC